MTELLSFDVFCWDVGRVSAHSSLVNLEVRPVAEVIVRKDGVKRLLGDPGVTESLSDLQYHLIERGEHHVALYIFKYPHLREVVKHLSGEEADQRVFVAWANGKMFGYSEAQIANFVDRTPN